MDCGSLIDALSKMEWNIVENHLVYCCCLSLFITFLCDVTRQRICLLLNNCCVHIWKGIINDDDEEMIQHVWILPEIQVISACCLRRGRINGSGEEV